jgi:hypothetical protein
MILPVHEGSQGVVHILSRLRDFRLQQVYRLLKSVDIDEIHPSIFFSKFFLSHVGNLGYTDQLFLLGNIFSRDGLPSYYRECLDAWHFFKVCRQNSPTSVADVLDEPLFGNTAIRHPVTDETLFFYFFVTAGDNRATN